MKLPKAFSNNGHNERTKLFKQLPKNVQILLGCSFARIALSIWTKHCPDDNRPLTAIETTEGYVLGTHSIEQVRAAQNATSAAAYAAHAAACAAANAAAYAAANAAYAAWAAAHAAASAASAAFYAASAAFWAASADVSWEEIYNLYLHTKGPDYPFKQEWKTGDVIALVNGIVQDRAFDRMPILADALQDADLTDSNIITHLQRDECYLSYWVICSVMGW